MKQNSKLVSRAAIFLNLFCHLPFLVGILIFLTLHLGLTLMRVTAFYLYEGLLAMAIEHYAAYGDRVLLDCYTQKLSNLTFLENKITEVGLI